MTDGAFVAHVFVLSDSIDRLIDPASLLAYLPPICTQNSGWGPSEDPYFWKGMAYASLMQDEMAMAAIERSLDLLSSAKTSKYMLVS
jgi:hypothetical protein